MHADIGLCLMYATIILSAVHDKDYESAATWMGWIRC